VLPREKESSVILALADVVRRVKVKVTRFARGIPMRVIKHGKSHYLLLPRELVEYYDIKPGDVVTAKLVELKRLITQED